MMIVLDLTPIGLTYRKLNAVERLAGLYGLELKLTPPTLAGWESTKWLSRMELLGLVAMTPNLAGLLAQFDIVRESSTMSTRDLHNRRRALQEQRTVRQPVLNLTDDDIRAAHHIDPGLILLQYGLTACAGVEAIQSCVRTYAIGPDGYASVVYEFSYDSDPAGLL